MLNITRAAQLHNNMAMAWQRDGVYRTHSQQSSHMHEICEDSVVRQCDGHRSRDWDKAKSTGRGLQIGQNNLSKMLEAWSALFLITQTSRTEGTF